MEQILHLIDKDGHRTTMTWLELLEYNKLHPHNLLAHDMDYYLSHGYTLIEDVIEEFEGIIRGNE